MATPGHSVRQIDHLIDRLLGSARELPLLQLIELLHGLTGEIPRIRASRGLHFSGGEIAEVIEPGDLQNRSGDEYEIATNLVRLCGTTSPLPLYLVEEILHDELEEGTLGEFLDIFHHRLHELMYLGVRKQSLATQPREQWPHRLLNILGVDKEILPPDFPAHRLLVLAPLLSARVSSASCTQRIFNHFLKPELGSAQIEIREFSGSWVTLADDHQLRLGTSSHSLGSTAVLGSLIFDPAGCASIEVGLVGEKRRSLFAEGTQFHRWVETLIRIVSTPDIDYKVEVRVAVESVGMLGACYLGQNAWLRSADSGAGETRFDYSLFNSTTLS